MNISAETIRDEVLEARDRIAGAVMETPLEYSKFLSEMCGGCIRLKLENYQTTGSFKIRGALNKILSMENNGRKLVTSSTGNHAAAFIRALEKSGRRGIVYVPETISPAKLKALSGKNIEIRKYGTDCVESEKAAREFSTEKGHIYISPYNDLKIIAGQGTTAVEIIKQSGSRKVQAVLTPVGGGGLISGVAGYLKSGNTGIELIGCQPSNSAVMYRSVQAGRILDLDSQPTISDGTAGGIEPGSITFDICRKYVNDFILVSEDEIKEAIRSILFRHFMLIEGAAALPVAALLKNRDRFKGKNVVLVLTGCKLDPCCLRDILG